MSSGPDIGSPYPGSSESSKRGPIPPPQSQPGLNGPRISPDFRNGDFLSRLLAATPPYLYNIPLVPQSFFFSDMLKSFVQSSNNNNNAKANEPPPHQQMPPRDNSSVPLEYHTTEMQKDLPGRPPHRRRKRTWREVNEPPRFTIDRKPPPILDKPLELTTSNKHSSSEEKIARHDGPQTPTLSSPPLDQTRASPSSTTSPPLLPPPPPPLMLPNLPPCGMLPLPDFNRLQPPTSTDGSSLPNDLLPSHLPPFPPPLWYPSMYPGLGGPNPHHQPPFGIDPLHFFIDLRVSGHIWDRKLPPFGTVPSSMSPPQAGLDCTIDRDRRNNTPFVTELESDADVKSGALNLSNSSNKPGLNLLLGMKNSKHSSAFSVPEPKPLMMTTSKGHSRRSSVSSPNTNYVLQNLKRIYKSVKIEDGEEEAVRTEVKDEELEEGRTSPKKETPSEGEGEKKGECKDLPALIGLELVVDYVKHETKPGEKRSTPPSTPPTGDAAPNMLAVTPEPEQAASP
ncbi:Hypothetical predicted protein [Cloeon dipterum]|uniref:Uncharacterized protein n=1 Tax=Cloeon dipterum TaxID=197152 RepID=A0A8S1CNH8_9INSE|nr:Hypothetical predicted protein [Cloeon dipterum]